MTDGPIERVPTRLAFAEGPVESLASEVVSVLARQRDLPTASDLKLWQVKMIRSACGTDPTALSETVLAARQAGVGLSAMQDRLLPDCAKALGTLWETDKRSFVEVTIACARLQSMLRDPCLQQTQSSPKIGRAVVLAAKDNMHTFGAMLFAAQLRRVGLSVEVALNATKSDLRHIRTEGLDLIAVSCGSPGAPSVARRLISELRRVAMPCPPIVVGGPCSSRTDDLAKDTGADHVATDYRSALRLAGVTATEFTDKTHSQRYVLDR